MNAHEYRAVCGAQTRAAKCVENSGAGRERQGRSPWKLRAARDLYSTVSARHTPNTRWSRIL
jgi:hypothetical protein